MKSLPIVLGVLLLAPLPAAHPEIQQSDAKTGGEITIMLPGDVPLVMVRIPAGSFLMGSPPGERGRANNEGPRTNVTLTRDFHMGKYPVTQAQWAAVMGEEWPHLWLSGRPDNPIDLVSWNDAQDFIAELANHIEASGQGPAAMRLPTEAEWEYAARAGTSTRFHFGDSLGCDDDQEDCAAGTLPGNRSDYMWWAGNSNYEPQPVGQKLPNAFGLHDMHGNVFEWCQDWFASWLPGGSVTDPTGPSEGTNRVRRGGANGSRASGCRAAFRAIDSPSTRFHNNGFRLAMDAPLAPPEPELEVLVTALLGHEAPIAGADVNQDGVIDAADIVTLLEMASKSPTPSPTPPPDEGE